MGWSKRKFPKNNWVWLSIVTVPIVAVIVGLMAFDLINQGVVTANNRSGSMPQELVEPMSKNPALVASQETPVDRLFRFGTYVSFRSAFGDQQGWIHILASIMPTRIGSTISIPLRGLFSTTCSRYM
jgi:hypothetical protein